MIAPWMHGMAVTVENGQTSVKRRRTIRAAMPIQRVKPFTLPREMPGQGLLILTEDMDGKMICSGKGVMALRPQRRAPQHQRRIKRNRSKGIRGHSDGANITLRGDHDHPGAKTAEGRPQSCGVRVRRERDQIVRRAHPGSGATGAPDCPERAACEMPCSRCRKSRRSSEVSAPDQQCRAVQGAGAGTAFEWQTLGTAAFTPGSSGFRSAHPPLKDPQGSRYRPRHRNHSRRSCAGCAA